MNKIQWIQNMRLGIIFCLLSGLAGCATEQTVATDNQAEFEEYTSEETITPDQKAVHQTAQELQPIQLTPPGPAVSLPTREGTKTLASTSAQKQMLEAPVTTLSVPHQKKVSQNHSAVTPQQANVTTPVESALAQPQQKAVSQTKPLMGDQAAYNTAMAAFNSKRYTESEKRFADFIQQYPQSKLVPNAFYWKGESLYSRGQYADAILEFKKVIAQYPKHHKTPDAMLKSGMAYQRINDTENARLHYRVLVEDFPHSPATKRGRSLGLFK